MVTHDPIAASYADRIVILGDGKLVADRPKSSAEEISAFTLSLEARS
jgi:putative ABC transport system ATP-binding protein